MSSKRKIINMSEPSDQPKWKKQKQNSQTLSESDVEMKVSKQNK